MTAPAPADDNGTAATARTPMRPTLSSLPAQRLTPALSRGLRAVVALFAAVTLAVAAGAERSQAAGSSVIAACAGTVVGPANDIQTVIGAAPPGTTFCFRAGVYRIKAPLAPKSGNRFVGEPGTVISGARDISSLFVKVGNLSLAQIQSLPGTREGICRHGSFCQYPDDVFVDDKPLERAASVASVGQGKYFVDYSAGKIYLSSDTIGHRIEIAQIERAFVNAGFADDKVVLSGLTIEKFATSVGGAIRAGRNWVIDNCEVRLNHRAGIEGGNQISNNYLHDNGQLGYIGYALNGTIFSGNIVARNNYADFNPHWEAGGMKIMRSQNVTASDNHVYDNNGVGMWTDFDNLNILYVDNRIENNGGPGIFHEASADAIIRRNVVRGNGFDAAFAGWLDGSGIVTNSSRNVEIAENIVEHNRHGIGATQTDRGIGPFGPRVIHNLYVHDNWTKMATSTLITGVVSAYADPDLTRRVRFERNHYETCVGSEFAWKGNLSQAQWVAAGQDLNGTFVGCQGESASYAAPPAVTAPSLGAKHESGGAPPPLRAPSESSATKPRSASQPESPQKSPTAGSLTASPRTARAGRLFKVSLGLLYSDIVRVPPTGRVLCSASAGNRSLRAIGRSSSRGRVTCVWKIPRNAKGKSIRGVVGVDEGHSDASRRFTFRVTK